VFLYGRYYLAVLAGTLLISIGYSKYLPVCPKSEPIIAIDIGHSIAQPGAISARGIPEFEFNHALALVINGILEDSCFRTLIVNAHGQIVQLVDHAKQAKGVDFLLSVHHDSVQEKYLSKWIFEGSSHLYSDQFHGYSIFVSRKNPFLSESLRCASAIGNALRQAGFQPSEYHAESIVGENKPFADKTNGVHFYDNLVVLKKANSPAILLEAGVIVNRDDEHKMLRLDTHEAIGNAVRNGLHICLSSRHQENDQ